MCFDTGNHRQYKCWYHVRGARGQQGHLFNVNYIILIQPGIDNIRIDQYHIRGLGATGTFCPGAHNSSWRARLQFPTYKLYRFCVACRPSVSQIIKENKLKVFFTDIYTDSVSHDDIAGGCFLSQALHTSFLY